MKHSSILILILFFATTLPSFSDEVKKQTLWQPGGTYVTHISYDIDIQNAELEPGEDRGYHGRYRIPRLHFCPVINYRTDDIVLAGENYYGKRTYDPAFQSVSGIDNVKWKSDNWAINPRRWYRWACRIGDSDLDLLRDAIREYEKREKAQKKANEDAKEAERDLDKQRKHMTEEVREAEKELAELAAKASNTEEGSKKRTKAEAKLQKVKERHAQEQAKLQAELDKRRARLAECREAAKRSLPGEPFSVFYDTEHNEVPYDPQTQALFFQWTRESIAKYFRDKRHGVMDIRIGPEKQTTGQALQNGWSLPLANPSIPPTILSEFGVSASAIFDDPTGERRLIQDRKKWTINASAINSLLATEELKKLISFRGKLYVERYPLKPSDCEKIELAPFNGWKIQVYDSSEAEVGYDTGDGYVPFSFQVSQSGKNRIEFWFDSNNEVLRYAKIEIEKEDYEGNIPNPGLGKMLATIKGTARGSVTFRCEYKTAVNQTLPDFPNEDEEEAE